MNKIKFEEIAEGIPEFIHVFDERKRQFFPAWLRMWKRQDLAVFFKDITLDDSPTSVTSDKVYIAPYSHGHIFLEVEWTLTPTNVQFYIDFSADGVDWHTHVEVPFSSLIYVPAAGDKKECIDLTLRAPWMRARCVGSGTTAANKAKVGLYVTLNS